MTRVTRGNGARRRRLFWWLPPLVLAGLAGLVLVAHLVGANYGAAFVMFSLGAVVVIDRGRERFAFRRGWERGYSDALHEMRRRARGQESVPASVMRWLVTGHPAPEPWEPHPADEDSKETNG